MYVRLVGVGGLMSRGQIVRAHQQRGYPIYLAVVWSTRARVPYIYRGFLCQPFFLLLLCTIDRLLKMARIYFGGCECGMTNGAIL